MRRFLVPRCSAERDAEVIIVGEENHHLLHVCRLEAGEVIEVLDGAGHILTARLESVSKKQSTARVLEARALPELPLPHLEIVLCLPHFKTVDLVIEKCVELGVHSVQLVTSQRSFVGAGFKGLTDRHERWRKIADQACKQCRRAWPLELPSVNKLADILATKSSAEVASVFLYEGEASVDVRTKLVGISRNTKKIRAFVGPEGGFSPSEVQDFGRAGIEPVTMGEQVLRVETACIALASIIQYEFDQLR